MQKLDSIIAGLRREGYRITPQRVAILDYILSSESHPSAEELHEFIKKKHPMVSLATVYKTLELLKEKNLVRELKFAGGARYDANVARHVNLICVSCERIEDMEHGLLEQLESDAAKKSKYSVLGSKFELYGYCSQCQKEKLLR